MILATAVAIVDTKKDVYMSEGYKLTKKNENTMKKEVDRLNEKESGRYTLQYPLILKSDAIKDFRVSNY